ncbi:MAG: tRNA 2-thiouridine(34) synthase MnmA, partial [Planctomycetota bacterium]
TGKSVPQENSSLTVAARNHQGCCSASDAADARFVAGMLGIPFYALNFEEEFDDIIDYFADEYARGRTPNPCVVCNDRLKFGKLMDYADVVGAEYVATGHYARIGERGGRCTLLRGCDRQKDQSYVLFGLRPTVLDRVLFPIGELTKPQVREIAARYDLPNRDKPDSVEICFVPDRNYARVVRERRPDGFVDGDVVDETGRVVGRHQGIGKYTVGQRRGLGIAAGKPIYVTGLDVLNNRVTVGDDAALLRGSLVADRANLFVDGLGDCFEAQVKIRYLHTAVPATVHVLPPDDGPASPPTKGGKRGVRVRVVFDEPQRAVTPGQAVVFYDGDVVLGGAWIENASDSDAIRTPCAGAVPVA